jgi:hypothetical protein
VRAVLERVSDELDNTTRVVVIRSLDVRWRIPADRLDDADIVATLAADLVIALRPAWDEPIEQPSRDAQVVVFTDEAAWWADALTSRSRSGLAWYHRRIVTDDEEPLHQLSVLEHASLARAVLRRLGPQTAAVLAAAPDDAVIALARALTHPGDPGGHGGSIGAAPGDPAVSSSGSDVIAAAGEIEQATAILLALSGQPDCSVETRLDRTGAKPANETATSLSETQMDTGPVEVFSHHAGLFYLAALVVELGTADALWEACLAEGQVLAWAAAALVGDDPVTAWFGGVEPTEPRVSEDECAEVLERGVDELAAAITRRRDAPAPPLHVRASAGEIMATLPGSAFPVWIAPCTEAAAVADALGRVALRWPAHLVVPPALAGYGPRGRVEVGVTGGPLFRVTGPRSASRLATAALGASLALLETRCDRPAPDVAEFVARYLQVPGWLVAADAETVLVRIGSRDVNFAIRRAGLDRDPGYLPWLARTVRFRFEGGEPDEPPSVSSWP